MWEVVGNSRSEHIYIKEQEGDKMRAVAMIPTGMINNTEQAMKDAKKIVGKVELLELAKEVVNEQYVYGRVLPSTVNNLESVIRSLECDNND